MFQNMVTRQLYTGILAIISWPMTNHISYALVCC